MKLGIFNDETSNRRESMRYKKRRILLLILILVLLLNVLRLVGIIDFNLYRSSINSNQTASIANSTKLGTYRIEFEYNNKIIYTHNIIKDNQESIPVVVEIEEYNFTGNYYMPFFKKFTTTYKCTFKTSNMSSGNAFTGENQIRGEVEGTVISEIKGICSIKKAKDLAIEKAFVSMKDYVINSISKQE
jgi:hypothetical protein